MGFHDIIDRYEKDTWYQENMDEQGYSMGELEEFCRRGKPENRETAVTIPFQERSARYAHWTYSVEGSGPRGDTDPRSVQHGGTTTVPRQWIVGELYNSNEQALRRRAWTSYDWSFESWQTGRSSQSASSHSWTGAWQANDWESTSWSSRANQWRAWRW